MIESIPDASDHPPIEKLTYEQALNQLNQIVAALETDELSLEKSLELFERGQALAGHCGQLLETAELRIRQLSGDDFIDFQP